MKRLILMVLSIALFFSPPNAFCEDLAAPSGLTLSINAQGYVELNWQDNSDNEDNFEVYRRDLTPVGPDFYYHATVEANTTTYTDQDVEPGKGYRYCVKAVNSEGESPCSNKVSIGVPDSKTPSNLTLSITTKGYVKLNWQDNSSDENSFRVYRRDLTPVGPDFYYLARVETDTATYTDTMVEGGKWYRYCVVAVSPAGASPCSNKVSIEVPAKENISRIIRFQGKLNGADGDLIDGNVTLTFRLYEEDRLDEVEPLGQSLWEEVHETANVENGILDVELGGSVSLNDLPFDKQYWLGIEVESDGEMIPRFKLTTVPYAIRSEE